MHASNIDEVSKSRIANELGRREEKKREREIAEETSKIRMNYRRDPRIEFVSLRILDLDIETWINWKRRERERERERLKR